MNAKTETQNSKLILAAITLLAFWARVQNLTYHSIWFDESISIRWAQSSYARIWDVSMHLVEDRLPPLYYLWLKAWTGVAGFSEFSLRYLSVLMGVLLIPLIFALGAKIANRRVGTLAALLTALNPFLIWYSQEARMYALSVLVATLAVFAFLRATESGAQRWWWVFGGAALAGLYTHLYSAFLLPALAIWFLCNPKRLRRYWLAFGVTMAGVSLAFAPLAWAIWRFSGESTAGNPLVGMGARAWGLFRNFTIWQAHLSPSATQTVLAALAFFALVGTLSALRRRGGRLLVLLLLMPFAVASVLMLRSELAFFGERYFIVMVPWLLLIQAMGAEAFSKIGARRIWMPIGAGVLVVATVIPLPGQWSVAASKEAWRQTLSYLTAHAQPADVVFIHPEWVRFPYQYYAKKMETPGRTAAYFFSVDAQTNLDDPLNGVVDETPSVVWLIESHIDEPDPDRRVENWFAARYPLVTELYPPGVILKAYAPHYQLEKVPNTATPIDKIFANGVRLQAFETPDTALPAQESLFHPPSNWIHVTLYWALAKDPATDAEPFVHLVDSAGQVWGASLTRSNDAWHIFPPVRWMAGQIIRHDVDVNLNPATPLGDYRLVAGIGDESVVLRSVKIVAGETDD